EDRPAGRPEGRQHLVAGGDASIDRAAEGGLETAAGDACVPERAAHRLDAERGEVAIGKAPERMQADARDVDRPHDAAAGAKAYDATAVPSSSGESGPVTHGAPSARGEAARNQWVGRARH